MQSVLFTKLFRGMSLEDIASTANDIGFDGVDLLVRKGHQVEPGAANTIGDAVRFLNEAGLTVPMVTTDLTDPSAYPADDVLTACAEAGVKLVRLGYWKYDPAIGYSSILDTARRNLAKLVDLAAPTGVRLSIQLHGGTIHGSGAQTLVLLQDHAPEVLGAYADPGNQVVQEGREDWRFTFDVLKPWLCCVGVKNGGWFPQTVSENGQRHWNSDWYGLSEGMVPWDDIASHLAASGYAGLLSFHSHYEIPFAQVKEQTRLDLQFFRRQLGQSDSA